MEQDYFKYLKTEREISEFKIESLKKMINKGDSSTKRLLAIEEEFLQIPFEKITGSLSELLSAIKIFRDSRNAFYNLYPLDKEPYLKKEADAINLTKRIIKEKIQEVDSDMGSLKIKDLRGRSRVLIILISIFLYLEKNKEEITLKKINVSEVDLLREIEKRYIDDIFIYYNEIIKNISNYNFISEASKAAILDVKQLINISETHSAEDMAILSQRLRGRLTFGFFLNVRHSGREILKPYYMRLYDEDGLNISKIFSMSPRAVLNKNEYYKFISLLSPEEIKHNILLLERFEILMKKIFHLKLSGKNNLKIDSNKSLIFVPVSRTEDEGIKAALSESSAIFSNILKSII